MGFTNLPLIEVSARITLAEPLPFGLSFIGDLRDQMRAKYADVDDAPIIQAPGNAGLVLPAQIGQVGAVRFTDPKSGVALHVQPDLAMVFWNQTSRGHEYPLHGSVFEAMAGLLEAIQSAAGMATLDAQVANMVYVKMIPGEVGSAAQVIERYYGESFMCPRLTSAPSFHELNVSWRVESNVDLRFHVRHASVQLGDAESTGYTIADSGGLFLSGLSAMDGLTLVHHELSAFFRESITEAAKNEWGYTDNEQ